jgi:anti-anti-sigma factor
MITRSWIRNLFASSLKGLTESTLFSTLRYPGSKTAPSSAPATPATEALQPSAPRPGGSFAHRAPAWASQLVVEVRDLGNEVFVRLQGEAGYLEATALDAALQPARARRPARVTLDLSELHFISSLALGVLVGFRRSIARTGGRVRFTALRPNVRETIERAGLAKLLPEPDAPAEGQDGAPNWALVKA